MSSGLFLCLLRDRAFTYITEPCLSLYVVVVLTSLPIKKNSFKNHVMMKLAVTSHNVLPLDIQLYKLHINACDSSAQQPQVQNRVSLGTMHWGAIIDSDYSSQVRVEQTSFGFMLE